MGRTSLKNKLMLSFLLLLLIVLVGVAAVNRLTQDFLTAQAISVAFAMAAGVIFGGLFSRSLVQRIRALCRAAEAVSGGDLSQEIPRISRDEIRDLEEVFGEMVNHLRDMIGEIQKGAQNIREANARVMERVSKLREGSRETDLAAEFIARASEEQTLIVQKTSVGVRQAVKEMDAVAKQTNAAGGQIREASIRTEMGERHAREALSHLGKILEEMASFADPIDRLSRKIQSINTVVKILDDLSQKTDLLSLNASIEATRSGEMGRRFGLMADEIRSMAEHSKRSAGEIGATVQDILEDNRAVMEALARSREGIQRGQEIVHSVVGTLAEMLAGVRTIHGEMTRIEEAIKAQTEELRELLIRFEEVHRLARENFLATQRTAVATRTQREEMERIVELVDALGRLSLEMTRAQGRFRIAND